MSNALQIEQLASGVVDASGVPLAGGKVYTYTAGSTTDKSVYTDSLMTTPATNPVILNAAGVAVVYGYGAYKFAIYSSADVLVRTLDNQYFLYPSTTSEVVNAITYSDTPYSVTAVEQTIKVNSTSGATTVYLPTAVGNEGLEITVIKTSSDANNVVIDANTLYTQTINGAGTNTIVEQYAVITVVSDNANWVVKGNVATGIVTASSTTTLTNKTLTAPTITAPTITGTSTIGNGCTLTTPTIASFVNATHTHATAAQGGATLTAPTISAPVITGVSTIAVEAWTNVTLTNSWTNTVQSSYMKDPMGIVHLKGALTNGGSSASAFTLGTGYFPEQELHIPCGRNGGTGSLRVYIHTDGHVAGINHAGDSATTLTEILLDGITFKAA